MSVEVPTPARKRRRAKKDTNPPPPKVGSRLRCSFDPAPHEVRAVVDVTEDEIYGPVYYLVVRRWHAREERWMYSMVTAHALRLGLYTPIKESRR